MGEELSGGGLGTSSDSDAAAEAAAQSADDADVAESNQDSGD